VKHYYPWLNLAFLVWASVRGVGGAEIDDVDILATVARREVESPNVEADTATNASATPVDARRRRTNWRDALVAEALEKYDRQKAPPDTTASPDEARIFVTPRRPPVDPDVVVLEPLTVTERFDAKRFELAMQRARVPATRRRWGTGLVTRDFGKVRVGVCSILYVPVMIGLSW
jgi:hypothetical protein